MWNRIDKNLTAIELQNFSDAINQLNTTLSFAKALTPGERKKGGSYLTDRSLVMMSEILMEVKNTPASFVNTDIPGMEKDLLLLKQLSNLESQVKNIQNKISDTRRLLQKDLGEQSFLAYNLFKILHNSGIADGAAYTRLRKFMPASKNKND